MLLCLILILITYSFCVYLYLIVGLASSFDQLLHKSNITACQAYAPSTWKNLQCHWKKYLDFCNLYSLTPLPVSTFSIVPFLQEYSDTVSSYSTVSNVYSSIKTMSKMYGHGVPDNVLYVANMFMLGLKRQMGTFVNQKLPVTPHILLQLYTCVDFTNSLHVCVWSAMLFMFFTFFRKSNVMPMSVSTFDSSKQVTRECISVCKDFILVSVTWSKTIQHSQKQLLVPVSVVQGSVLCPVTAYLQLLDIVPGSTGPAFSYFKGHTRVPLTYNVFTKMFRLWLQNIGISHPNLYSPHSFRRGGATWAFQAGVSPTLIKLHGDWQSDCYLQYVKLSVENKMLTTAAMARSIQYLDTQ